MLKTPEVVDVSTSHYASSRKELLKLVKQLRAMGAQADLDLPRVTVIGNQSAGKSSVVEAISGITVPRDAGTCTRCPMECRLSSSDKDWSCQISIRWEFMKDGRREDQVIEKPFGHLITDKNAVELILRQAQSAVLNPDADSRHFLQMDTEALQAFHAKGSSLQFSRNTVCVDLEGPGLTDLSFIDLPGIIQNADDDMIKLVEDLVVSHIKGNCLILVALPMTDDIENQRALRLARQEDPQGRRTIGVLTKPDMLGVGATKARDLWLEVIEGRRHPLTHGYFCTRQPDDEERSSGISSADARARELEYFRDNTPWSSSTHRDRFGVNNLVASLSNLLVRVIKDTLPHLRTETMQCLDACKRELADLPQPISTEPVTYMLDLVMVFSSDISRYVEGARNAEKLIRQNREAYRDFLASIRTTAPNFRPYLSANDDPSASSDDCDSQLQTNAPESSASPDIDSELQESTRQPIYLPEMRRHIAESITRELPGNVPFDTKVALIAGFQENWAEYKEVCFSRVKDHMLETLKECIDDHFRRYAILHNQVSHALSELVDEHYQKCNDHLEAILAVELTPFTQNDHYYETSKDKYLTKYKDLRAAGTRSSESGNALSFAKFLGSSREGAPSTGDSDTIRELMSLLAKLGHNQLKLEDLAKLNPPDEYENELQVMAEVRGYFKVSYKRVIDNVPSLIDLLFLKAIRKDVQRFLTKNLSLGAADARDRCVKYLAEDPMMVARRDELIVRKKRLDSVQSQLRMFGV